MLVDTLFTRIVSFLQKLIQNWKKFENYSHRWIVVYHSFYSIIGIVIEENDKKRKSWRNIELLVTSRIVKSGKRVKLQVFFNA